jgi:hypothetical protein
MAEGSQEPHKSLMQAAFVALAASTGSMNTNTNAMRRTKKCTGQISAPLASSRG